MSRAKYCRDENTYKEDCRNSKFPDYWKQDIGVLLNQSAYILNTPGDVIIQNRKFDETFDITFN